MGRDDDGEDEAESIALEAGAIERCEHHGYIKANDDTDANEIAYKIAANRWKAAGRKFDLRELTDAVKRVIDQAPDDCVGCEANKHA